MRQHNRPLATNTLPAQLPAGDFRRLLRGYLRLWLCGSSAQRAYARAVLAELAGLRWRRGGLTA